MLAVGFLFCVGWTLVTVVVDDKRKVPTRQLLALREFRRLLYLRFSSQWADGLFQTGLAGAVIFNPERGADPLTIATGFTALLLPYSIVGPFAGALLDRWDRRRVLVVASLLRAGLILAATIGLLAGAPSGLLFLMSLMVLGVTRFMGSGLSAALPHVVPERNLVQANSIAVTLGSIVAVFGGGCAIALRKVFGEDDYGSGITTSFAIVGTVLAVLFAVKFERGKLGPDQVDEPAGTFMAVARGLFDGARAAWQAPRVVAGFVALFAHRISQSIALLMAVLLMRYYFTDFGWLKAGLTGLGEIAAFAGVGIFIAGLVTPKLVDRFGRHPTVIGALLLVAAAMAGLGLPMTLPTMLGAAFLMFGAGQVIKLCVDAVIQADIGDESRGRVFSLYDMFFNVTQVAAIAVAAAVIPANGHSHGLIVATIVFYLLGVVGYVFASRRDHAAHVV
ncbi:MFS-type transporter involved in bile tolerance, Atg22 family [Kibdelosporangium aridum]|uniref:MFS-type transporter involved in bile tolerance, Atg22 family n=1 Tax=Kibdelosporangium aridum TaxID=2030 RepID=A0A1Y5XI45_KIBAR|nr:MFS-type transporter involved in bile tolerance, Atg22 family [Kibdelosporangium aridum]